jgi:hypothetical protein
VEQVRNRCAKQHIDFEQYPTAHELNNIVQSITNHSIIDHLYVELPNLGSVAIPKLVLDHQERHLNSMQQMVGRRVHHLAERCKKSDLEALNSMIESKHGQDDDYTFLSNQCEDLLERMSEFENDVRIQC